MGPLDSSRGDDGGAPSPSEDGHHELVAQPHRDDEEGPVAEAEAVAAEISTPQQPLGRPGKPLNRRSPFFVGMLGAAGVAATYLLAQIIVTAQDMLVLIGLAWFIAIGLEPAVSWLVGRGLPRWAAVTAVFVGVLGLVGGFFAAAIPVIVEQAGEFAEDLPGHLQRLHDDSSPLGRLNDRFGVEDQLRRLLEGQASVEGALGAGQAVLGVLGDLLIVVVLTIYFLADLPRIRQGLYRMVPHSRRPRVILIGDEIFAKVGGYVLGNLTISLIAGSLTFLWLLVLDVPYALLLAVTVALLDLIPVIGATLSAVVVSLVAFTVSLPVGLATIGFFVVYQLLEDYVLVPRIIGRAVKVPALVTVVAVLLGGVLLGVIGALVAIPIAAAVLLILREVTFPRLDKA
ncbi:putative PurR-regulated permease PerM [Saccharothrix tamanrassetensis]|uniref:Putative PurR-regulated permease PerM n=1 Tax=Saccharothrix tamanrassetensis TaxID=1051531 RepID=A0A841CTM1_9PSEU|nr:AI-2E family transporter [Saccharothrix tamanrassetensis]MBB5959664.1 putative PurR-regulated permease PerM [Saccharothrix tamanrassetensis]